ncbi:MAG TPA: IS1595 family transposase [Thermoanaerobaculia bacterium]|jgi:transposase-like protein|nr:IS1595 family transposase [Thermoanaerobaculia bacterium]
MSKKQKPETKMDMNLGDLIAKFGSDDKCRAYLELLRWSDGVACPRCATGEVAPVSKRNTFYCESCHYHFSVTTGTVMHDTHLPLWKWFAAAYLMVEARKGVSANQLKRTLTVSYKTAWYLCHRIRKAMEEACPMPLSGTVEVDETWIGGKRRHVGGGYVGNKTMVLGAVQRDGAIRLRVEERRDAKTLRGFINDVCVDETERIYTDDHAGYVGIGDHNTVHESVNHSAEEYVRGDVHTNSIEGVWSLFNRAVVGSYHQVSGKHLDRYLSEFEFRFNNRHNKFLFRDTIMKLIDSSVLTYAELTGKAGSVIAAATDVQPTELEPF